MWSPILPMTLFATLTVAAASVSEDPPAAPPDAVQAAFDRFVTAASRTSWPDEFEAREALLSLGPVVIPKLTDAAGTHDEVRVRRSCYDLLTNSFRDDPRTAETLLRHGLLDQDHEIRYRAAFILGDSKVEGAAKALHAALDRWTGDDFQFLRYTLAKSLAQLGEAEVLPTLYLAVSDDAYMSRYVGNIGLKALSGRNLEDFDGYKYSEGTHVHGGTELIMPFDALRSSERKAARFQAAAAYFKWLKEERPELYSFATYRPRVREDRPRP